MSEVKCNAFIMGAPKCGTTSLAVWLNAHPKVRFSKIKEPHFFYQPYHTRISLNEYHELFVDQEEEKGIRIEASVWYLFSETAATRIMQYNPNAKFVVSIRNPMEMSVSLHSQAIASNGTAYENTLSFEEAWSYSDKRFAGSRIGINGPKFDTRILAYKQACFLGSQLENLLSQVPRSRVHVIVMDDLKENPRCEWLKLLDFLSLEDDGRKEFSAINVATRPRSFFLHKILNLVGWIKSYFKIKKSFNVFAKFHNKNMKEEKYEMPPYHVRLEMLQAFESEIQILERLLKREFPDWRSF